MTSKYFLDDFLKRHAQWKWTKDTPYIILHVDLSVAHTDLELNVGGDLLKVVQASDNDAAVDIKINFPYASPIPMFRYRCVYTYFDKFYLTNAAQPDAWIDLLVGVKQVFDITDFFFRVAAPGGVVSLPRTTQTVLFQAGDDGDYEKGLTLERPQVEVARFTDNGDGTITDAATGLMWVKDPFTDIGAPFNAGMTWANALINCEALIFAGHDDWRLPNIFELTSLLNFSRNNPCINTTFFPNTQDYIYWSSTTLCDVTNRAFWIYFAAPKLDYSVKTTLYYVRPVRLGIP